MLGTSGRIDNNNLGVVVTCFASAFAALRVQIAFAISDVSNLGVVVTCFASAFAALRVQIAFAISRTGGAGLADNSYLTKNPASFSEAGFYCLVPVAGLEPARF